MTLAPGAIISDRYRILEPLGEGGMGAVFRAEHVHMRKMLALKVLLGELAQHPEIVARFEREAIAAAKIAHPNVVTATDFGRLPDGSFFMVMEYVAGQSLRDVLKTGPVEPLRALRIVRGMLAAIEAAHAQNIVHRDLKPENVMLTDRDGDPDFVKVLDFGIAKLDAFAAGPADEGQILTRTGTVMGTPEYMAPEQAVGQPVDARSDLYSVGIIFYEMLVGSPPFHGDPVVVMRKQVLEPPPPLPDAVLAVLPGLAPIVDKLLAKQPEGRFSDAREARAALAALDGSRLSSAAFDMPRSSQRMSQLEAVADTVPPPQEAARSSRRVLVVVGATFLGLGALVAIVVGVLATRGASAATVASAAASASASPPAASSAASEPPIAVASASASASSDAPDDDPPAPTKSTRVSTGKHAPTHKSAPPQQHKKTGPGGIYIPPPKTWFK